DGIRDFHVTGVQTCALPIYQCRARLYAVSGPRLLPHRGHRVRDDRHRRHLARSRPASACAARTGDHRALGARAAMTAPLYTLWGYYARWTARWPALAALVPYVPLVAIWAFIVWLELFPRVFLPGPVDVMNKAAALIYKGSLTDYLADSLARLAVGAAA